MSKKDDIQKWAQEELKRVNREHQQLEKTLEGLKNVPNNVDVDASGWPWKWSMKMKDKHYVTGEQLDEE